MQEDILLIEWHYWGNIAWYQKLLAHPSVTFDMHEHFRRGTFRNRTQIMGPNGLLNLSIPVVKGKLQHSPFQQVKISYAENWRKDHWMSIVSSYRRSAYFEYYEADFEPLYKTNFEYLYQLNEASLQLITKLLKLTINYSYTESYISPVNWKGVDGRDTVHPTKSQSDISEEWKYYPQVFTDRLSFMPNLSIMDMLFNLGPKSVEYLRK